MILLYAVAIGLASGLIRAWVGKREYRYGELRYPVLVLVAFAIQVFVLYIPITRQSTADSSASILLTSSLLLLLVFSVLNIKKFSFWPITTGFFANFLVIILNGGFMPISPETIEKLRPEGSSLSYTVGQRFESGKDIVLNARDTILPFLSDRLVFPEFMNSSVAFSLGDILIAIGVVWLLWSMGAPKDQKMVEKK